jgi:hypothetical protein
MIEHSARSRADWQPERAVAEAQKDLAAGTPKIYISGTITALAPGVDEKHQALVRSLPRADAGIGCIVVDEDLRKAQFEYARRYNEYIVGHLFKR